MSKQHDPDIQIRGSGSMMAAWPQVGQNKKALEIPLLMGLS